MSHTFCISSMYKFSVITLALTANNRRRNTLKHAQIMHHSIIVQPSSLHHMHAARTIPTRCRAGGPLPPRFSSVVSVVGAGCRPCRLRVCVHGDPDVQLSRGVQGMVTRWLLPELDLGWGVGKGGMEGEVRCRWVRAAEAALEVTEMGWRPEIGTR